MAKGRASEENIAPTSEDIPSLENAPTPSAPAAPAGGYDTRTLARIDELEKDSKHTKRLIEFVNDTNRFILVVMFVGILALIFTVIFFSITAIISDTSARETLTSQVMQLNSELQRNQTLQR